MALYLSRRCPITLNGIRSAVKAPVDQAQWFNKSSSIGGKGAVADDEISTVAFSAALSPLRLLYRFPQFLCPLHFLSN